MSEPNGIIWTNCRLCQQATGEHTLNHDFNLKALIFMVTNIQVDDDLSNVLPNRICGSCKAKIESISQYRSDVLAVDAYLRKLYLAANITNDIDEAEDLPVNFKCEKCPASFAIADLLEEHRKSHDVQLNYTCKICSKSYNRIANFNLHKKSHIELYCSTCDLLFDDQVDAKVHICGKIDDANCIGVDDYSNCDNLDDILECNDLHCEFCNKKFDKKCQLQKHLTVHKDTFSCPKDRDIYQTDCKSLPALKHQESQGSEKTFLCVTCGKVFLTKSVLNCHEKIHLDVKSYVCKLCNLGFSARSNLRTHERNYHLGMRFYCSQCTKSFVSKNSLERHEKIHLGIREFKCETCSAEFYTSKELINHQKYHKGIRKHLCRTCFKTFFEKHHLLIHMRIHTGERPFVCQIQGCDKSFVDNQKLKRHLRAKHSISNKSIN